MTQNHINWTTRIKDAVIDVTYDTHVPPDISFKIEQNGSTYIIDAHKAVMGWVSNVFNRMFLMADTSNQGVKELLIKRTTKQAFQIMKDAIYRTKDIEESLKGKPIQEIFLVLDLVSRYEIPELVDSVMDLIDNFLLMNEIPVLSVRLSGKSLWEVFLVLNISIRHDIWELFVSVYEYLDNFPLTEENVMDVAEDAMRYAGAFKDEVRALLNTCVKFLKSMITDSQFSDEDEDEDDVVKDVDSRKNRKNNYFQKKRRFEEMREKDYSRRFGKGTTSPIDWTSRLQQAFNTALNTQILPDITFKIEENSSTYEIDAHKMVMGWASIVFNKMFFVADTKDKYAKVLLVKGTTKQAFQIMKEAIYNIKPIKQSLQGKSVDEVFAVLDLVTRYDIPELLVSVMEHLDSFPLTKENVLDVAEDAMHYTGTFEDEAHILLTTCAKFLLPKLTNVYLVFEYVAENKDRSDVVVKLQVLMKEVVSARCTNCRQDPCMDGNPIQPNHFRDGLIVTNRRQDGNWSYVSWGTASVVTITGEYAQLKNISAGNRAFAKLDGVFVVSCGGTPTLLFSCK